MRLPNLKAASIFPITLGLAHKLEFSHENCSLITLAKHTRTGEPSASPINTLLRVPKDSSEPLW